MDACHLMTPWRATTDGCRRGFLWASASVAMYGMRTPRRAMSMIDIRTWRATNGLPVQRRDDGRHVRALGQSCWLRLCKDTEPDVRQSPEVWHGACSSTEKQSTEHHMPFAQVFLVEGRTEDQKRAVIEKVTQALVEAVGAPKENVRVWLTEVPKENWGIAGVSAKALGR